MAEQDWNDTSATRIVDTLLGQRQRKLAIDKQAALGESERHRRRTLTALALIGSGLFIVVVLALVESWNGDLSRFHRWLLFGVPAVAGASGAAIRVLWDNWAQREVPLELRPITMTIALGLWASGVAGVLFVLPQIWAVGALNSIQASKLSGFAVPIGLLTGLTLDRVFPRLIKYEVPIELGALEDTRKVAQRPSKH
jgi:hypothetical protein